MLGGWQQIKMTKQERRMCGSGFMTASLPMMVNEEGYKVKKRDIIFCPFYTALLANCDDPQSQTKDYANCDTYKITQLLKGEYKLKCQT